MWDLPPFRTVRMLYNPGIVLAWGNYFLMRGLPLLWQPPCIHYNFFTASRHRVVFAPQARRLNLRLSRPRFPAEGDFAFGNVVRAKGADGSGRIEDSDFATAGNLEAQRASNLAAQISTLNQIIDRYVNYLIGLDVVMFTERPMGLLLWLVRYYPSVFKG